MIKTTITNKTYVVNILAAPVRVYAVLPDGNQELLRELTEPGQTSFIAQSGITRFEGGVVGLISGPFEAARVALGGGAGSTGPQGPKGDPGDPGPKGDKGDPGESPAAEDVALQLVPLLAEEVELIGPEAPTNTNTNYFALGAAYLAPGVVLREFGYHVKTNAANGMCEQPCYLGVWELAEDGATWAKLGASVNTQVQILNSDPLWAFELGAVKLSGRPLRFCLLAAREDSWRTDLLMGVRCVATEEADTYVYPNGAATAFVVKYTLRGYKTLTEKGDKGDPADTAQLDALQEATTAAQAAATAAQNTANAALNNANLANTNLNKEKNEALQHLYWHHSGQHTALAALMGDGGAAYFPEAKHVTEAERNKWNAYQNTINSKVDRTTLSSHTGNTNIHITAEERTKWNKAAESGGGFEDTGRITGGKATDPDSTATGRDAEATYPNSTATGLGAQATDHHSTATGSGAKATGRNSTATGSEAQAPTSDSTATGKGASATADSATATGTSAQAGGSNSTATGYKANSSGIGSFAYGALANADNAGEGVLRVSTSGLEKDNYATSLKLVGAGSPVSTEQLGGECGLGFKEKTADYRYIKLRDLFDSAEGGGGGGFDDTGHIMGGTASFDGSTAIGNSAQAKNYYSTAIGEEATTSGNGSIAIGRGAKANTDGDISVGFNAGASGWQSVAIGYRTTASGEGATATGSEAQASGQYSIASGHGSSARGSHAIAIGSLAGTAGENSLAIGMQSGGLGEYSVAIGDETSSLSYGVAIGHLSSVQFGGVAIGSDTIAQEECIAIGKNAEAKTAGIAIGKYADASSGGLAIGNGASASFVVPAISLRAISDDEESPYINVSFHGMLPSDSRYEAPIMEIDTNKRILSINLEKLYDLAARADDLLALLER